MVSHLLSSLQGTSLPLYLFVKMSWLLDYSMIQVLACQIGIKMDRLYVKMRMKHMQLKIPPVIVLYESEPLK